ncbi:restriction endonuclease subunit S [Alistipes hominis]|uniref:Restriction endonuclease subunit S n=1 Tax=Alistipes hominis TaxID=2763015 RepID=A0ABR7CPH3_9BACT|nr:restriction endonuclease subunit S [Alistipes hominis]MBC5617576.1 restriction endonuclease subunit S [Alistipes hominis]
MVKNNDNKALNVPHLRFPEFTGVWKKCIIGDLATKVGSGVTPRGGESVYKTDGHPFVRSQNVGLGHLILDDIAFIDEETHQRQKNTELQLDDVLLNITGASIGRSALVNTQVVEGNVNQHVCIIRTRNNLVPSFLCNFLLSNHGQKQIDSFQAGGNRQGLNFEQIKSIKIAIPSIDEQNKVAKLLQLIEERISTQNKIIKKLETLIKALSHKLTTQKKPNTLLKDCLVCHSSTLLESHVNGKGQYPVYGATGICGYTDKSDISGDSILIIKDGASVGTITYATGKYSVIGTLNYLQTMQEHYSLLYIYYSLKTFDFRPYITGMAIPHIYFRDYGKAKIWCPDIVEQKRIATVLRTMDAKLKINHSILCNLTLQKQYFIHNLFI